MPRQRKAEHDMSRQQVTDFIAVTRKIVMSYGVGEFLPLRINGITQSLSIRARDRRNHILLFPPGRRTRLTRTPFAYTVQSPREDYFTCDDHPPGTFEANASSSPSQPKLNRAHDGRLVMVGLMRGSKRRNPAIKHSSQQSGEVAEPG